MQRWLTVISPLLFIVPTVLPTVETLAPISALYARYMKDARFTIPTPALLAKVVDMIDKVPMEDRDTKGDRYEYMLGKIASAGQNGQFRTPRQEIALMIELVQPTPTDIMCDPAGGTFGLRSAKVAEPNEAVKPEPRITRISRMNRSAASVSSETSVVKTESHALFKCYGLAEKWTMFQKEVSVMTSFELKAVLASKKRMKSKLAYLPFAEKLRLLEAMRERHRAICGRPGFEQENRTMNVAFHLASVSRQCNFRRAKGDTGERLGVSPPCAIVDFEESWLLVGSGCIHGGLTPNRSPRWDDKTMVEAENQQGMKELKRMLK